MATTKTEGKATRGKRGGAQPGAGRPALGDAKLVAVTVRVPRDVADAMRGRPGDVRELLIRWAKTRA